VVFKDFFGFDKFLTPVLVKIIYWIGIVAIVFSAIVTLYSAFSPQTGGAMGILMALLVLVGGLIAWRVICESMILAFRIYDRLTEIRDQGAARR
jgi:uncharacterized oligopeptide transporter (OPT) family protein